jgi:hypothetical protein
MDFAFGDIFFHGIFIMLFDLELRRNLLIFLFACFLITLTLKEDKNINVK